MAKRGVRQPGVLAWLHLVRIHDKMNRASMEQLVEYDLTPAQFDVLAQLNVHCGISQQALSEHLLVTKGNVCGLIDRLEGRGLVERRCHPQDKRLNLLHLTEKGKALARKAVPAHEQFMQAQMEGLEEHEQQELNTLLRRLDRSLKP